jgi:hypothetical protein
VLALPPPSNITGEALYASGAQSHGVQLFQQIIEEVPEHFNALFAYGKALIEHAELSDAMPVFLKLIVHDSGRAVRYLSVLTRKKTKKYDGY